MLRGKLCVLVLDKFLVFYGHAVQIYFTSFDLVSVFCLFFDLTGPPNGPSWLFAPFAKLTAHLYWCGSTNLYSRHSAWLDGGGNTTPATIILWTKGLQKVHLRRLPEQHPFPGALHQPPELRGPSVSSSCTALYNYPPLVDLPEGCQTCLLARRARFSLTNLTLWP